MPKKILILRAHCGQNQEIYFANCGTYILYLHNIQTVQENCIQLAPFVHPYILYHPNIIFKIDDLKSSPMFCCLYQINQVQLVFNNIDHFHKL